MRGFSGGKHCVPLDPRDLTVEIDPTFQIPRPLGPTNSGPNRAETLCFFFVSFLITEHFLVHSSKNRVISRPPRLIKSRPFFFIRVVMSTISRPTSSSSGHPSSPLGRPSPSWTIFFLFFFFFFLFILFFIYHRLLVDRRGRGATPGRGRHGGRSDQCC